MGITTELATYFTRRHDESAIEAYGETAMTKEADQPGEAVAKVVCHASGDRCHGCAHYQGKAAVCEFAPEPSAPADRQLLEEAQDEYYLQDKRSYVGNDMVFWAKDGKGYTTDLAKAHVYTREAAYKQQESRETDVPWPKAYIDSKSRPAVDHQYVNREEALAKLSAALKETGK